MCTCEAQFQEQSGRSSLNSSTSHKQYLRICIHTHIRGTAPRAERHDLPEIQPHSTHKTCSHLHICTHTNLNMHTHTHTHTHIHMRLSTKGRAASPREIHLYLVSRAPRRSRLCVALIVCLCPHAPLCICMCAYAYLRIPRMYVCL